MVREVLLRHGCEWKNGRVTLMCDNLATVHIWRRLSSSVLKYSRVVVEIFDLCTKHNIHLNLEWVSTHDQLADAPSRTITKTECHVRPRYRTILRRFVTLDCFAVPMNKVCDRYISNYNYEDQVARDALSYDPTDLDYLWLYPPQPSLIIPIIKVLVVPSVKSMILHHHHNDTTAVTAILMEHHTFRLLVGTRRCPFAEAPCQGKNKERVGVEYFRRYTDPVASYIYFKGYTYEEVLDFALQLRRFDHIVNSNKRLFLRWHYWANVKKEILALNVR